MEEYPLVALGQTEQLAGLGGGHPLDVAERDHRPLGRRQPRARATFDQEPGVAEHFVAMMVHLVRARRLQGQGRLGQATDHAGRGVELARRGAGLVEVGYATRELAELRHQAGDTDDARRLLDESRQAVARCADPGILATLVEATTRRLAPPPAAPRRPCPVRR
jgi:hypothetical protein